MNKLKRFIRKYSRQLSQICLLLVCILLVTCFMPREKSTQIAFKENAPWEHGQIIADFSFDVPKLAEDLKAEREKAKKATRPYFNHDPNAGNGAGNKLKNLLNSNWRIEYNFDTVNHVNNLLRLYRNGIVSDEDYKFLKENKYTEAIIVEGNRNITKEVKDLIPFSEAVKAISADKALMQRLHTSMVPDSFVYPNYTLDLKRTMTEESSRLALIDTTLTSIQKGQRIINQGDIVDHSTAQVIRVYLKEVQKHESAVTGSSRRNIFFGQILFVIITMSLLYLYICTYHHEITNNNYKYTFTLLATSLFPILVGIMETHEIGDVFILPFAMVPMLLCLFINNNAAFVAHTVTILICSIMIDAQDEFIILQLTAGYSVILSLKELSSRSQMFRCIIATFMTYTLVYLCYNLMAFADVRHMNYAMFIYFAISSLLTLMAYPMMIVIEKTFHFVSNVTLIELSNLNSKLLLKMSQEAPGTFQHSIQVSNLAAEGARAIGANILLVRTGALYHDIGKTSSPIYFTENQSGGINPHDSLTELESARIIENHVIEGLEIAKREGLPQNIRNFICTHHGATKTGYFYIKYKNAHPDENIDEELFTYPGPKPSTREQAILMMADCVEAASHSLKEYTEQNISSLVDSIIDKQLDNKEFSQSPITFQDVDIIKNVFKTRLMAIYHTRISYPKENKKE